MAIFKLGELFSGPGGLGYGASLARVEGLSGEEYKIDHAWANDYDEFACETYRRMIMPSNPDKVISPVIATLERTGIPVNADTSAVHIPTPALGPSLGVAPSGTWI